MDLKRLLNCKTVVVLLSVVVVNVVVFALLWRLDGFVHGDLYSFGLVFSLDWAGEYWDYNWMVRVFLGGATLLAAVSMIPQYMRSRAPTRFSKYAGFFLPVMSLIYQALAIVNLNQINNLVWNRLYAYGLQAGIDWSLTYNPSSMPALALMVVALFALIITVIATLNIIEIEIVYEDESSTMENTEKAAEPQETVKPMAKEEVDLAASIQSPLKQADSTGKPLAEEIKHETAAAEVLLEHETVRKRRRRKRGKRKRRRKSRSMAPSPERARLVTLQGLEEAVRPPEITQFLAREETESKSSGPISTKEIDNTIKLASEDIKLDRAGTEASALQKPAKRRRKRRRRKARGSRAGTELNTTKTGA